MRVINCFTDPRLGGPGTRTLAVSRPLRERDIDVHFLVPTGDDSLTTAAREDGYRVHRVAIPRIRSPRRIRENAAFLGRFRHTTRQILAVLERVDPDVVHVNTPYNFQTARAASLSGGALVWHFNDTLTPWPINRAAGRLATRWADEIAVSANAVHEHFFGRDVETRTLYPPVDLDEFDPDGCPDAPARLRAELDLKDTGPVVGTIANMNPAKGHRYLLDAAPDVLDAFPDARFLIVGSRLASQQRYFRGLQKRVSRLGIDDAVQFTGWRADVPELLSLFDVFVLPSITEACPMVVLEAMAMECPLVATDVGGVSEQVPDRDHGWVVPPRDPNALAAGITHALSTPEWRRTATRNARRRVEDVFALESCVTAHLSVYESALGQ